MKENNKKPLNINEASNSNDANVSIVKFIDGQLQLDVKIDENNLTVWLDQSQIAELFNVNRPAITKHISNIFKDGELGSSTCSKMEQVQIEGNRSIRRNISYYNLDMIISIGYRVKSQRGVIFRQWANSVLKDYLIKGYAINDRRLVALNKTIDIQNRMLSSTLHIDNEQLSN